MKKSYEAYDGQAYRDITWRLRNDGIEERLVQSIIENIRAFRNARTKDKAKRREQKKQWGELISSLQHERKIVRSMVRYKTSDPAPERDEFTANYMAVLDKLHAKLTTKSKATPELPEHSHWTDYVPIRIKAAFVEAALAIPTRQKAKTKTPFERRIPLALFDRKKNRLTRSIRKSMETLKLNRAVELDTEKLDKQESNLRQALRILNNTDPGEDLPRTWHGLLKNESAE